LARHPTVTDGTRRTDSALQARGRWFEPTCAHGFSGPCRTSLLSFTSRALIDQVGESAMPANDKAPAKALCNKWMPGSISMLEG
jgi:hypothetical protein